MRKRLFSIFLAVSMVLSLVQIPINAAMIEGADRASIDLVALEKTGDGSTVENYTVVSPETLDLTNKEIGTEFYIGIQVNGFANIEQKHNYDIGISKMTFGIEYDSSYVEPSLPAPALSTFIKNTFEKEGEVSGYPVPYYYYQDSNGYTYDITKETAINANTHTLYYEMTWGGIEYGTTTNYVPEDNDILLIVPFKTVSIPENGANVFYYTTDNQKYSCDFGIGTDEHRQSYQLYNGDTVDSEPDPDDAMDILNIFDYDETGANVFPKSYTVTYMNGDAEQSTETVVENGNATNIPDGNSLSAPVGQEGKFFDDWYYAEDGSNVIDNANTKFTSDVAITADTTVFAKWVEGKDITFNSNYPEGGDTTKIVKVSPKSPSYIPTESEPTVGNLGGEDFTTPAGYIFKGWNTQKDGQGTEIVFGDAESGATDVSSIDQVYAIWSQEVTVSFHDNDGTDSKQDFVLDPTMSFEDNGETVPTPTREGYTLTGWNTKSNGSGDNYTSEKVKDKTFTGNTDLYAMWTPTDDESKVTLTFDVNAPAYTSVSVNPTTVSVNPGDIVYEAYIPDDPNLTASNYQFDGWYDGKSITANKVDFSTNDYVLNEDKTVYAHWTYTGADKVTVTFDDDNDTTIGDYASVTVKPGTTLGESMPANPEKDDYSFDGWYTEKAGAGTEFTGETPVNSTQTVYAKWAQNVTIHYDVNGGDGTIDDSVGAVNEQYTYPVTEPTKENYEFIGWNTKQNGSGTYIKSDEVYTFGQISAMYEGAATEVTVYAQWAAVPDGSNPDEVTDGTQDSDPAKQGVKITFDGNVAAENVTTPIITQANPQYKYVHLGDSIGTANMPDSPTRTDYVFQGWNTKADGTGTTFTGDTAVSEDLDGVIALDDPSGAYELTLYAQWTVDEDSVTEDEKVTVTFNKNTDGAGTDDSAKTYTIKKGDVLGFEITDPVRDTYYFMGWYKGTDAGDNIEFTADKYAANTVFTQDTTYYAKWESYLIAEPQVPAEGFTYTGEVQTPEFKFYVATYPSGVEQPAVKGEEVPVSAGDYTVTYEETATKKTEFKDAGTYKVSVKLNESSALAKEGKVVALTEPATLTINKKQLTFKVDPATQVQKFGSVTDPTITVEGNAATDVADSLYNVEYYLWTDAGDNNGQIESGELSKETGLPSEIGKYVTKIKISNENYVLGTVESTSGVNVLTYPTTEDGLNTYPVYPEDEGNKPGENIVFEIKANDPSIASVIAKYTSEEGEVTLADTANGTQFKQNDYEADQVFDTAETPAVTDYYARVTDTEANEVTFTFTLTNPDTTTLTANVNGTPAEVTEQDGVYTITATLDPAKAGKDGPNVVTVTTKAGTEDDDPTITYTFNLQQFVEAKINLGFGNSPYGLIENMANVEGAPWNAEKIEAAKAAFNTGNKFTDEYLPEGGNVKIKYIPYAWNEDVFSTTVETDPSINLDRNPYALFVYQGEAFADAGFTAVDSLGNPVSEDDVTMQMTVKKMSINNVDAMKDDSISEVIISNEMDGDNGFEDMATMYIRPDVYDLTYSFTDPVTNETVEETRKVVMLWKQGDTNLSTIMNPSDSSYTTQIIKNLVTPLNGVTGMARGLYYYRIVDIDMSSVVNPSDASTVTQTIKGLIPEYRMYNDLQ